MEGESRETDTRLFGALTRRSENASLSLSQLYAKFRPGETPPANMGRDRDWAIDLVPKFLMANGELTNMLVHTEVTRYLEFKQVAGSYVYRDGRIAKVPATEMEAVRSSLMGIFEKRRMKKFLEWVQGYRDADPSTHRGMNPDRTTMAEVYKYFGLEEGTRDFIGHAMALYLDDAYLQKPARATMDRITLYASSVARYGKSPYIYPLYGLGELPQAFARLSAIYGGTYMLDKPVDKVEKGADGFIHVTSGEETVRARKVVGDWSYFKDRVRKVGTVIRAICLLTHPIPNTDSIDSVQIILPQNQVARKHDIYIAEVGNVHNVVPRNYYVAIVSTIVETDNPQYEIEPALRLLGPIHDKFVDIQDLYEPTDDGTESGIFVSRSNDATSHFETLTDDVLDVYRRMEGKDLVLKQRPATADEGDIEAS